jgi:hypothetical protein
MQQTLGEKALGRLRPRKGRALKKRGMSAKIMLMMIYGLVLPIVIMKG